MLPGIRALVRPGPAARTCAPVTVCAAVTRGGALRCDRVAGSAE